MCSLVRFTCRSGREIVCLFCFLESMVQTQMSTDTYIYSHLWMHVYIPYLCEYLWKTIHSLLVGKILSKRKIFVTLVWHGSAHFGCFFSPSDFNFYSLCSIFSNTFSTGFFISKKSIYCVFTLWYLFSFVFLKILNI